MVKYALIPDNQDCKLVQDVGNRKDKKISTGARERGRDSDIEVVPSMAANFYNSKQYNI
jgi:hypothetical protein